MRYNLMLFICVLLCDGFFSISGVEENEIDPCMSNPCKNGGCCIVRSDVKEGFSCSCADGYGGEKYETGSCEENSCENGGSCIVWIDGEKRGISCNCADGYSGERCQIAQCNLLVCKENEVCEVVNGGAQCIIRDPCTSNPCKNGGSCIAKSDLEEGFSCICADGSIREKCEIDQCTSLQCQENEVCVEENGGFVCKITDPCTSNPCKNGGSCIPNSYIEEGFICNCADGYSGEKCKTDQCSLRQCDENEVCVAENGDVHCKIKGKSDDTSEDLATTTPIKVTSTTTITTHKENDNKTTTSGNTAKTTNVTEPSNTDKLLSSSSIVTRNTTAFTKATTKITKSTKNEVTTTTRVSLGDHSSTSIKITSEINTDDHHKHFTITSSNPSVGNTTSSDNNRVQTSHTLTDGLTTVEYTANTKNLFKSSSQSSPTISSLSSTSMSTSVSTSDDNSGYTSERPQITISTSTTSKEKTETIDFKSTSTYASTTETLNNTSANNHDPGNDINRTNESSKSITIYASLGAVCFAVLVAFAVGGWYLRRRYRRRKRQCYTECDTSSEISRNSDSSYSSP